MNPSPSQHWRGLTQVRAKSVRMRPYTSPVYCTLYILRAKGKKLPADVVRSGGIKGWIWFGTSKSREEPRADFIIDEAGDPTLTLHGARVTKIEPGGIMIHGQERESFSSIHRYPQAWWLVPSPEGAVRQLDYMAQGLTETD